MNGLVKYYVREIVQKTELFCFRTHFFLCTKLTNADKSGTSIVINGFWNDFFMPPNFSWHCKIGTTIIFTATLCSTSFVVSMTFERFYSIIKPHKAASFNTIKRAKITIAFIILFSTLYHIPHLFVRSDVGLQCVPYSGLLHKDYGKFYQFFSFALNFALPFLMLLIMNNVIIHILRRRSKWSRKSLHSRGG